MENKPERMCIACRLRESQRLLIRLQHMGATLVPYSGTGRSIYLCQKCCSDDKKIVGVSKRFKIDIMELKTTLKEIEKYG